MRTILLFLLLAATASVCQAQNPVSWSYTVKKVADKTYEVHLAATIQSPWHIYSQNLTAGGPISTGFTFAKNPLVILTGKPKEAGKMVEKHEEVFDMQVRYYENKVDFVQVVKLKTAVKTNIAGTIEYMACNDDQCLPPRITNFSIAIQ